jgi:hypothetical protein
MSGKHEPKIGWRLLVGLFAATQLPELLAEGGWHVWVLGPLVAVPIATAVWDLAILLRKLTRRIRKRINERRMLFIIPETPVQRKDRGRLLP